MKEEIKCLLSHGKNTLEKIISFCNPVFGSESLTNYSGYNRAISVLLSLMTMNVCLHINYNNTSLGNPQKI